MLDDNQSFDVGTPARIAAGLVAALVQSNTESLVLLLDDRVDWSTPAGNRSCRTRNEALDAHVRLVSSGGWVDVYETTIVGNQIRLRTATRSVHPPRAFLAIYDIAVDGGRIDSVTYLRGGQNSQAPLVELLYFDGCPTHEPFLAHLLNLLHNLDLNTDVNLVHVNSEEEAAEHHFLGSPSLRINGRDVDPNAQDRKTYAVQCRLYPTPEGLAKTPPDAWIATALTAPAREPDQPHSRHGEIP